MVSAHSCNGRDYITIGLQLSTAEGRRRQRGPAELSVSCDVPRAQLLDATAHSILCIVRELAANAVRHGKARHVEVLGSRQTAALVFTVRDDGAGFDAAHAAGLAEGHFGLSGIRERTAHLEGTFDLASEPGKGTTATFCAHSTTAPSAR